MSNHPSSKLDEPFPDRSYREYVSLLAKNDAVYRVFDAFSNDLPDPFISTLRYDRDSSVVIADLIQGRWRNSNSYLAMQPRRAIAQTVLLPCTRARHQLNFDSSSSATPQSHSRTQGTLIAMFSTRLGPSFAFTLNYCGGISGSPEDRHQRPLILRFSTFAWIAVLGLCRSSYIQLLLGQRLVVSRLLFDASILPFITDFRSSHHDCWRYRPRQSSRQMDDQLSTSNSELFAPNTI